MSAECHPTHYPGWHLDGLHRGNETVDDRKSSRTEASLCRQHPQQKLTDQSGAPLPSPQAPGGAERIE
ncbi:hypothetical protein DPMN_145766 [Dreissena polymorpha]|uniref:Uncharacterized protein n=1 Tax=Dreissena polymorpha TaxID=45954 RepID=A0A9D4IZ57_DREPO|nr:hypothetical protein DPMN_145766 [Dreissena polymorpha]